MTPKLEKLLTRRYRNIQSEPQELRRPRDPLYDRDYATDEFLTECDLVEIVSKIGHGTRYITQPNTKAGKRFSWNEGYVNFLVMSSPPGDNLFDIYEDFSNDQRASIS
ncbi:uncharacterized protein ASPGLDRAFT_21220 [Aspergillus glaucus CBS 516.65]|uniref:Uncharacterized protein n=1 Tax=Aspergillus glaucus CBS 516.65 TaxID=1160497 RepID=A0A1L9VYR0_ASPGL|nr:hypothetical protein ASPGLDRAFT_21220 [Aspergillus glaucus CBS 516.65]OJJ89054.1 hypothetical protein ASPGLDRAFT_21220 [Aspergillus glaucus CBS 516.65]